MKNFISYLNLILILTSEQLSGQNDIYQHEGFYLRVLAGYGYAELVEEHVMGSEIKYYGKAETACIQIGGAVSENFIIYGEIGSVDQKEPKMEWMGQSRITSDTSVSMFGLGGGITYYLMPDNIYFSLSLLSSSVEFDYNNTKRNSEFGYGLKVTIGKEWWFLKEWAMGVTLYGYYSTMKDIDKIEGIKYEDKINNYSIGGLFSITFN